MSVPFSGAAIPMTAEDIASAARTLACEEACIKAVLTVETGGLGGFLSDGSGRPRILFEAHVFSELTGHMFDATHPSISSLDADWSLYVGGAGEYDRLQAAAALNATAGLKSTSWGLFQILGESAKQCGFASAATMAAAMAASERQQLAAFAAFVFSNNRMAAALRNRDWSLFARLYNGPDYTENRYDVKLAAAFAVAHGMPEGPPMRIGSTGPEVKRVQQALAEAGAHVAVDGQFGRVTELAVMAVQRAHKLRADGIVGSATVAALGL